MRPPTPPPGVPGAGLIYRIAAQVAWLVMRRQRWRIINKGLENVPRRGGCVIAANHNSFWDFFTVGYGPYVGLGRPVRILAKQSLFEIPVFGWLVRKAQIIPVNRRDGRTALRRSIEALNRGELILIMPEQTISRSFELLAFKTGAARMAIEAGVPLVPAVSWGSQRFYTAGRRLKFRWRLPVTVRYGEPLHPQPGDDPRVVTKELAERMQRLLEEAVRTYPDGAPAGAWWVPARFGGGAPAHQEIEAEHEARTARWRRGRRRRSR